MIDISNLKVLCPSNWDSESTEQECRWPWEKQAWNYWMKSYYTGQGVVACYGTEVSHSARVLGVTLNLGQRSRNIGTWVYLPCIGYIKFWMATHWPETWSGRLSFAALRRLFCWPRPCWAKSACSLEFTQTPCQACPESCLLWLPVLLHNISLPLEWLAPVRGQQTDAAGWRAGCGGRMGTFKCHHGLASWRQLGQGPSNCLVVNFRKKGVRKILQAGMHTPKHTQHTHTHTHTYTHHESYILENYFISS
jgi:hypothetical protein